MLCKPRITHALEFAAVALVFQGCASTAEFAPSQDTGAITGTIPDAWSLAEYPDGRLIARWSDLFNDPVLNGYLVRAERDNNTLKNAQMNVRIAELSIQSSRARLRPSIGFSSGVSGSGIIDQFDNLSSSASVGLSASQNLDLSKSGALSVGFRQLQRDIEVVQFARLRDQIMADVCRLYISIIEAEAQQTLTQTTIGFLRERVRVSDVRFSKGLTSENDLLFAKANLQSTTADMEQRTARVQQLRRTLAALLGTYDLGSILVASVIPDIDKLPILPATRDVLFERFDVQLALIRLQLAAQSAEITNRANDFQLSVGGSLSGGGSNVLDIFDPAAFVASLSASLLKQLYDGGDNAANREASRLGVDQALRDLEQTLIVAKFDIENSYQASQASRAALLALDEAVLAANEALRVEQIKFEYGKSDLLSVLQVQQTALSVNASKIRTQASVATELVNAYVAVGAMSD